MPEKRVLKVREVSLTMHPSGRLYSSFLLAEDDKERGWRAGTLLFSSAVVGVSINGLIETENTCYQVVG